MERLPGFRDFYPEPLPHPDVWSADARQFIFDKWRETARATVSANTTARRSNRSNCSPPKAATKSSASFTISPTKATAPWRSGRK